jgi:outer membrane protein TolC
MLALSLLIWCVPPVSANERVPETRELTREEAVAMAIKNSNKLKSSTTAVEAAYEGRQKAASNTYGPSSTLDVLEDSRAMRFLTALQSADASWQAARKDLTLREDSVKFATNQTYSDILKAQASVHLGKLEKKNAETQRTVTQARYMVGMAQVLDTQRAESEVVRTKGALEDAEKSLENAYIEFNHLVGLWNRDRPVLSEMPEYEQLEVINLDSYIERSIGDSPSQWQVQNSVTQARYAVDSYDVYTAMPNDSYRVRELTLDQRVVDAAESKEQARKALRTLYNNILQMEEQYPIIEQNIKVAKEALRVTKLMHDTGMATKAEVVSAETTLSRAEKGLMDLICSHDIQKQAFATPWALGM